MKGSTPHRRSPAVPTVPALGIVAHVATLTWTDPSTATSLQAQLGDSVSGHLETAPVDVGDEECVFGTTTVNGHVYYARVRAYLNNEPGPWTALVTDTDP
jgi:hypothetical protein